MRVAALAALILLIVSVPLRADQKDTDFDPQTDFLKFKTFTLRPGQIESTLFFMNATKLKNRD
jgi:hypothetical protein